MSSRLRYIGQVLAIDRSNRQLTALVDGITVEGVRYSSWPREREPRPLCDAWFSQDGPGSWRCVRPIGHRRVIFHDDFTRVSSPNGDTPWTLTTYGGGTGTAAAATGVALGAVRLSTPAAAGGVVSTDTALEKDASSFTAPSGQTAYLLSARARPIDSLAGMPDVGWGIFADSGGTDYVLLTGGATNVWSVKTSAGSVTVASSAFAVNTWNVYELMWAEGFAAGWVDGDGPYYVSASVSASMRPGIGCLAETLTGYRAEFDYVTCEAVSISQGVVRALAA